MGEKIAININNLNLVSNKFSEPNNNIILKNKELPDENIYEKNI